MHKVVYFFQYRMPGTQITHLTYHTYASNKVTNTPRSTVHNKRNITWLVENNKYQGNTQNTFRKPCLCNPLIAISLLNGTTSSTARMMLLPKLGHMLYCSLPLRMKYPACISKCASSRQDLQPARICNAVP